MDPDDNPYPDNPDAPEILRVIDAIWAAIIEQRPPNPSIALSALLKVTLDVVMKFPPEQRELAWDGAIEMLTALKQAAARYYPEEFGRPTKQ
jgi:hypothetical protein